MDRRIDRQIQRNVTINWTSHIFQEENKKRKQNEGRKVIEQQEVKRGIMEQNTLVKEHIGGNIVDLFKEKTGRENRMKANQKR